VVEWSNGKAVEDIGGRSVNVIRTSLFANW
jgi:hypothetical protein